MNDVRKRNERWEARVRTGGRDARRLSKTFDRKSDAARWVTEMRRRYQLGEFAESDAGTQTLDEFVETWWAMHVLPNLESSTRDNYRHVWDKHLRSTFGQVQLRDVTTKMVNRHKAKLLAAHVGPATVRRALVLLQSILSFAVQEEELDVNPILRVKKPHTPPMREHVPIPVLTLERMRQGLEPRDQAILSILGYAGLRPQEALALRFEDIGERTIAVSRKNVNGTIHRYTKTLSDRYVRLHDPLREDLEDWARASGRGKGLLFPRPDGEPFTEPDYRNWRRRRYEPAAEAAGLDASRPYDLRATWVSLMIFEGHTVIEVARQAGHSPEVCLRHYARVLADYDPADRMPVVDQIRAAREELALERLEGRQEVLPGFEC